MKDYLVFRLYGPMASWGQAAVGGDRPTGVQPTRSAIIGLLAAALGIKRESEEALQALQNSILVAVKQCVPSSLLRDYHTSQVPSFSKKIVHRTRRSELEESKLNTILSSRDYRCDGLWIVAIKLCDGASVTLTQLEQALIRPVFMLSLGRKSCPLALPMCPRIVLNQSLRQALDTDFPAMTRSKKEDMLWLRGNGQVSYSWEGNREDIDDDRVLTTQPWDDPVNRTRWQFKQRTMYQLFEEVASVPV